MMEFLTSPDSLYYYQNGSLCQNERGRTLEWDNPRTSEVKGKDLNTVCKTGGLRSTNIRKQAKIVICFRILGED